MRRKRFEAVCRAVCVAGFLLMLGTAGASDADAIPFDQIVWQLLVGLAMFAGGGYLGGIIQ